MACPFPEDVVDLSASIEEIRGWEEKLIGILPAHIREVVVLHYWEDLTLNEIGPILDIPVGTVKSRLAAGLRLLRSQVKS